ncbi:MAG: 3-dehydroquinate synthase [Bryobacteraceae bacterium]
MSTFEVQTPQRTYLSVVERGILSRAADFVPRHISKVFIVTTIDVWNLYSNVLEEALESTPHHVLFLPGGEVHKRLSSVEELAVQMMEQGADRASMVIGFGGGIVTDVGGFLAAIFMRGIELLQIPTTLLAQVDAGIGGKTGVNLENGKNLIGSFHQPLAVLIDPEVIASLPEREYHAGLFEVIKCGVIRDPQLFRFLRDQRSNVLSRQPETVDQLIAAAVRIKAEVVTADEKEGGLRRILNFGHTVGHAIESETGYNRFLHGEAIAWGMLTATRLAVLFGTLGREDAEQIEDLIRSYGPLPSATDLDPAHLIDRLSGDKKTIHGKVHFVLPTAIGEVTIKSGLDEPLIRQAILESLQ